MEMKARTLITGMTIADIMTTIMITKPVPVGVTERASSG
jgi:hypothetical protein